MKKVFAGLFQKVRRKVRNAKLKCDFAEFFRVAYLSHPLPPLPRGAWGSPPRHPAVHLAANGATPPLEGRGVFPKVFFFVEAEFGTLGAVLCRVLQTAGRGRTVIHLAEPYGLGSSCAQPMRQPPKSERSMVPLARRPRRLAHGKGRRENLAGVFPALPSKARQIKRLTFKGDALLQDVPLLIYK